MARITIKDLPKNMKLSATELRRVWGGDLVLDYRPPLRAGQLVGLGYGGEVGLGYGEYSPWPRFRNDAMVGSWSTSRVLR